MTDDQRLRKKADTPPTGMGTSVSGLPGDLLQEAARRLGWAALVYSTVFLLADFGPYFYFASTAPTGHYRPGLFEGEAAVQTVVALISIASGLIVFWLSRRCEAGWMKPAALLDLGLVFLVLGSLGISVATVWGAYPEAGADVFDRLAVERGFMGIPWECVWIVFYPVVAPNTPGKTLLASLAAASTGLFTITLSRAMGLTSPDVALSQFVAYYLFTTYLCAGIAFVISKVVYGFGRRLRSAREVGSYQLIEPLGGGGMGEVWLATHRMLARPAAIKLIRPEALGADGSSDRMVVRRFEREAQATAGLRSIHTIEVYDFGVTEQGAFYYVMELLNGVNLEELIKRFGPVSAARAVYLMRQVCHSLSEAHERGLIHRDIKPANIYTCRLGPDYDFVKVLDFGLVKATGAAAATELTAEGIAAGTPAFMAPELALRKSEIDGRADVYALGCVGYWLVTGTRVFEADSALAMIVAHVQEPPMPPSRRTEIEIPDSLERIILDCLEKDPARRPQTAAELEARLAGCRLDAAWNAEKARDWWELHLAGMRFPEVQPSAAEPRSLRTLPVSL